MRQLHVTSRQQTRVATSQAALSPASTTQRAQALNDPCHVLSCSPMVDELGALKRDWTSTKYWTYETIRIMLT